MIRTLIATLGLALAVSIALPAQSPVQTVPSVDLGRYLGDWREVARFPNGFQDQCAGDVRVTYAKRDDGRIDVTNRCRRTDGEMDVANGVARVVDTATNAKLEVRFAPAWLSFISAVWGDYWIIGLDAEYRWAVVGDPSREYLWILSRTPSLDRQAYDTAVDIARRNGFDMTKLQPTANAAAR